jgi:hypothetical protein
MPKPTETPTKWDNFIPWFLTSACTLTLIAIGLYLVLHVEWFKHDAFEGVGKSDKSYNIYIYQMYLAILKGSVGLFTGFALVFLGTGVAFYTLKDITKLNLEGKSIKLSLITASPGIIAMVLGTLLILFTIGSKNTFPAVGEDSSPASDTAHIKTPPPIK